MSEDVRYSYLHGPRRHVTIARAVDLDKMLVYCGISVCHPDDVFRKALGREMAEGRLEAGKFDPEGNHEHSETRLAWTLRLPEDAKPLEAVMRYLARVDISKDWRPTCADSDPTNVPTCVQELAEEWRLEKLKS